MTAKSNIAAAINEENGEANKVKNILSGEYGAVPDVARDYKKNGIRWVVVGDWNYGEGSSREHAALEPRHLGGLAIITRSFARIHETNLKKQGMVPLTFVNESDYDLIDACDEVSTRGLLETLQNGGKGEIELIVKKQDGKEVIVKTKHTLTKDQSAFVLAGSALNLLAAQAAESREEITRANELSD